MKDLRVLFGRKVRQLREEKNITQEELAFQAGVSTRYLISIEHGEKWPRHEKIEMLKEKLDVKYRDLFDFSEE